LVRVARYVNTLIALLLAVALVVVAWFVWRPLPQRSGAITAPVAAPVSVAFDARGVPHIRASSLEDALFVQGYVTAQDRLWQMDALRRYDGGDLAEVLGPNLLESDRESRRLRLRRVAESAYVTMPAADRAAMAAYARGVNQFIATHLNNLPLEFTLLGYQPRPWSAIDSLLICLHMFRDLTTSWRDEIAKRAMLAGADPAKVNFLFPTGATGDTQPGSNNWAIAGSHTASGKPLLSNDMHLEFSIPGIWYMVHLQGPGLNVSGVAIPGLPGVVVGHNDRIAWGITNLQFDVQDLYFEKLDEPTGRYLYQGHQEQARLEREIIRVKGKPNVEVGIWVTRHGPVAIHDGGAAMAMRWVAAEPGILQYPIVDIDRAQNWQTFRAALSRFPGPGSNFVYADVDGSIGYQAAGKLPIRRGYAGDVPSDGSAGDHEWQGFIPFDEMPSIFNPPGGMIVTANQNPFPANYPYSVNGNFAAPYRYQQIRNLLKARSGWRAEDLLKVQTDVYSAFHYFLAGQVVAAYDKRGVHGPAQDGAVAVLRSWNGQMQHDLAAPMLASLLYLRLRSAVASNASPNGAAYEFSLAPVVVERLLKERPAGWFQDYDQTLLSALVDAIEDGAKQQGHNVSRWHYGEYLRLTISNPVFHGVPWVGKYFEIGPVPMSGGSTTVKQTTRTLGPSMRMDADLADWDRSLLNTVVGQSGQPLSRHFRDQWKAYYYGFSYPMEFGKVDASSILEFRP
jgi:penicillin amidase